MAATVTFGTPVTGTGTAAPALTGVPAGATIGVNVTQINANTRTYTATGPDGALTVSQFLSNSRVAAIGYKHGAPGGDYSITVNANTGTTAIEAVAWYATGLDSGASPIIPTGVGVDDGADATTHHCAPSGEIDTAGEALIITASALSSNSGVATITPGSGYTHVASAAGIAHVWQYKIAAVGVTDDRGTWTHGSTARRATNTMIAFPATAPAGPARVYPRITRRRLTGGLL